MSGYRLCRVKTAEHPFYIESISANVWTIEELSFFLYHNPALLDKSIVGYDLVRWVASELELPELADKMEAALLADRSLTDYLYPIFLETDYLNAKQLQDYKKAIKELRNVPKPVRIMLKGNALFHYMRYNAAADTYKRALELVDENTFMTEENENTGESAERASLFASELWHNIGLAALKMLEYDEACDAFKRAFAYYESEENLKDYLTCYRLNKPLEKFLAEVEEMGADYDMADRIEAEIDEARKEEVHLPDDISAALDLLTEEYHASAGW